MAGSRDKVEDRLILHALDKERRRNRLPDEEILEAQVGKVVSLTKSGQPQPLASKSPLLRRPGKAKAVFCRTVRQALVYVAGRPAQTICFPWQYVTSITQEPDNVLAIRMFVAEPAVLRWRPSWGEMPDGFPERLHAQRDARLAQLSPEDQAANAVNVGQELYQRGELEEAKRAWTRAVNLSTGESLAAATLNLGVLAKHEGDLAAAKALYDRVAGSSHQEHALRARYNRASLVGSQGDISAATGDFEHVADSDDAEMSPVAAYSLAELLADHGDRAAAFIYYQRAFTSGHPEVTPLAEAALRSYSPGEYVVLGPYPLCALCREVNGGLVAAMHRQVHLRAYGKQSCVDRGLAGLIACLWAVCDTRSCCEDDNGRAYVVPTTDTHEAAERLLVKLGLRPESEDGAIYFRVPTSLRLHDAEFVRRALE
jgi:tetratricopeptide (TPR) repeat protein